MTLSDEQTQKLEIPSFGGCQGLISVKVVAELVERTQRIKVLYDKVYVVDCRFPYEYEHGHISSGSDDGWLTVCNFPPNQSDDAEKFFFGDNLCKLLKGQSNDRICIIFHCEFSSKRAPDLRQQIRELDRKHNQYPKLCLPETYVMEGGYKEFWENFPKLCDPQAYVSQWEKGFEGHCKKSLLLMTAIKKKKRNNENHDGKDEAVRRLCYGGLTG